MKISKIDYSSSISYNNRLGKLNGKQTYPNAPLIKENKDIFKYYMGRDMVSFGAGSFSETLRKNWFQLPNGYMPDTFQLEAGRFLNEGKDVLVEAPTGTGKTAIAHYVASKNIDEGKTTFYTTPLKALSNQKLNEFRAVYGDDNVGILTGDRRENVNAPIVIMTTEVYRNMALSNMYGQKNPLMENLGSVIFDEFHYLGDDSRGPVWEESIMLTPGDVQVLGLSATIGNPKDLKNWQSSLKGNNIELVSIPASARAVPLKYDSIYTNSYESEQKQINKIIKKTGTAPQPDADYIPSKPKPTDFKMAVEKLNQNGQLPAILFVFSRKYSRELLEYFAKSGIDLTNENEKKEIDKILNKYKLKGYIGSDLDTEALKKGYAIHNAGIIPAQKELIEELFQKKLTKVVIATETLAAGINMPAKTVVISSPYKPTDKTDQNAEEKYSTRLLTSNEFKQMSGRAGRRGIDTEGYVYTMPTDKRTEQDFIYLEVMGANPLESSYSPDYAFLSGYYEHNTDDENLQDFLAKSFYAYSSDEAQRVENLKELDEISQKRTNVLLKRGFLDINEDGDITSAIKGKMAAQVRGYDALTLAEAIASKKFENINPETLAMIAGAIANPADDKEDEINIGVNIGGVFEPSGDYIDSVYREINSSLASKLRKLGHDIAEFDSYQDMLEFVQNIEKPDIAEEDMIEELKIQSARRAKMYTITKQTGKMTPLEVVQALKKGEVVPSKVLEDQFKGVEQYKSRLNVRTISDYINKLEAELKENDGSEKGKKAKARLEKKSTEIRKAISQARAMEYLDEHLMQAMNDNYRFIQKNPPRQVKEDYEQAQQLWLKLTSKDEIISQIEALISMEDYMAEHDIKEDSYENAEKAQECFNELKKRSIEIFQSETEEGLPNISDMYGLKGAKAIYNWALLNKVNPYSMSNWEKLLSIVPQEEMDEGSIYRSVLQTADLLGQIADMADAGCKNSDSQDDIEYYSNLRRTASQARNLMIKYPVEV